VPLRTGWLEKWEFQIISMMKLKAQVVNAESLSLARAQRMNQNIFGISLTRWRKQRPKITFLTHLGTFSTLMEVANK